MKSSMNVCRASAGTGKTFTLAAYYVGLLLSGESYRNILAVTFTNKATAEMKERILGYLYGIATGSGDEAFLQKALAFGGRKAHDAADMARVQRRAEECFRQMLLDYDNVQVSTIDSFLQTLLSGMAKMLDKGAGFRVELNLPQVITKAVDRMLTTDMDEPLQRIMGEYLREQLRNEGKWDVRGTIIKMADELFKEHAQTLVADGKVELDEETIRRYKRGLGEWRSLPEMQNLANMVARAKAANESAAKPNKNIANALSRLEKSLAGEKIKSDDRFRGFTQTQLDKITDPLLLAIQEQAETCRSLYFACDLTGRYLNDMRLMRSLLREIETGLQEENRMLLARTAGTLREALKEGDADFILEKAGIRYRHIMIDEFQDTSTLQWQVFRPLIEDVLAGEGHTLLIVGDIKQSIYRWRNGDWHIMDELGTDKDPFAHYFNPSFAPLVKNFRSQRNVVAFNLATMRAITQLDGVPYGGLYDEGYRGEETLGQFYNAKNGGGFVRLRAFPRDRTKGGLLSREKVERDILTDMFATIEQLLDAGEQPSDIMILVRKGKHAKQVVDFFNGSALRGRVRIVSSDSFRLEQSRSVLLLVNALRAQEDEVARRYVELNVPLPADWLERLQAASVLPLYEQVQAMMRLLLCDAEGNFTGDDIAYVNCFMDKVLDYVSTEGADRAAFLRYWSDAMHDDSISAPETNAIRLMTVHSSKGLESKTLFIPFCNWEMEDARKAPNLWCEASPRPQGAVKPLKYVPVPWKKEMQETPYRQAYEDERQAQWVDNLNLLYVALTRAAENLFVYTDVVVSSGKVNASAHVGTLMTHVWGLEEGLLAAYKAYADESAPCYVEYVSGAEPLIHRVKEEGREDLFSFRRASEEAATLRSNSDQVRFRQSQESMLYGLFGEERAEKMIEHINIGNLCHDIFAQMETRADQQPVIDAYFERGVIESAARREEVERLIDKAWENAQMCEWFDGSWDLLREQSILVDGEEKRPDRVMLRGDRAIVLDYKFGAKDAKYHKQVAGYMTAMRRLGYTRVEGYLWYAREGELVSI